ncbi:MAG: M23 family metallopeptidase [Anaerolineae bacterium]|nr:M23 family metallopeptidase [Anaerolineae bacterium]
MIRSIKRFLTTLILVAGCTLLLFCASSPRVRNFSWFRYIHVQDNSADLPVATSLEQCAAAPFVMPTTGWIGIVYGDSILGTQNHSGLDIFGLQGNGVTPVYAAYDGYLTRLPEWTSAVIIRHPQDPLEPDRQIWSFYTHMADEAGHSYIIDQIPPGTFELPVKQGTLLGYQGDYNGQSWRSIDTHLHFSLVLDDGNGKFLNETDMTNTIDPSPYLGMRLNTLCADRPPVCRPDYSCSPLELGS